MAELFPLDDGWFEWLKGRPDSIKALAEKFPGNKLYRLKSTGHRVFIYSYSENNTMTVVVSGQYNNVMFERRVFGINPDELEECDFPLPDEPLGVVLNDEDTLAYLSLLKTIAEAKKGEETEGTED